MVMSCLLLWAAKPAFQHRGTTKSRRRVPVKATSVRCVLPYSYHRGKREADRGHRAGKYGRFARSAMLASFVHSIGLPFPAVLLTAAEKTDARRRPTQRVMAGLD